MTGLSRTQMKAGIPSGVRIDDGEVQLQRFCFGVCTIRRIPVRSRRVILEAATTTAEPAPGFLESLRSATEQHGAVLIFDEMDHRNALVSPWCPVCVRGHADLSTWGKAIGNGFAVSALAGKREFMEAGGLNTDASRVFLLSTTNGAETTGLAAYLAVSKAYAERDVVAEMEIQGTKLRSGLEQVTKEAGMSEHVSFWAGLRVWFSRLRITMASHLRLSEPFSSRSCCVAGCSVNRW